MLKCTLRAGLQPPGGDEVVEGGSADARDSGDGRLWHAELEEAPNRVLAAVQARHAQRPLRAPEFLPRRPSPGQSLAALGYEIAFDSGEQGKQGGHDLGLEILATLGGNLDQAAAPRPDYFELDLTVRVPDGWLVAGPGRRLSEADGRQRFRPAAPVRDPAFFAAAFKQHALRTAGVDFELLLHPSHVRNAVFFEPALGAVEDEIQGLFARLAALGVPYPFSVLSVVEVPATLREYGGGWRMPMALPRRW